MLLASSPDKTSRASRCNASLAAAEERLKDIGDYHDQRTAISGQAKGNYRPLKPDALYLTGDEFKSALADAVLELHVRVVDLLDELVEHCAFLHHLVHDLLRSNQDQDAQTILQMPPRVLQE